MRKLLLAVLTALFSCAVLSAQTVGTGAYPFASFDNRGFDSVNTGNLNTRFNIPIVSKAGRGLAFNYSIQDEGLIWSPVINATNSTVTWTPDPAWGFRGVLNGTAFAGYITHVSTIPMTCGSGSKYTTYKDEYFVFHDAYGAIHPFNYTRTHACAPDSINYTGDGASLDGSGYTLLTSTYGTQVRLPNGTVITPALAASFTGSTSEVDPNGNTVSSTSTGTFTDTTGSTTLTVSGSSPVTFTYPVTAQSNNATTTSANLYYKQYTVRTNFGCSGIVEYGSTSVSLVDHITLADGSTYSFTYEGTLGATDGAVTARVASIILPTGGTITYTRYGGTNGIVCADGTTPGLDRVTSDGTRRYQRAGTSNPSAYTTLVQDEKGNQSLYHFSVDSLGNYEQTHQQVYQGSDTSGTLLQEVVTCYNGSSGSCDGQAVTPPITEADTTTSYNGGSQATLKSTYDTSGNLLNAAAYSGTTLLEQTATTYNTNSEVLSSKTTDGSGNTVALTTYGYDETTPTATSGLPQHGAAPGSIRGNQTSAHVSIDGGTSNLLTTTTAYYDTGVPLSTTAPGGFKTSYGYESTQAFATSTTLPTPSSGIALSTSASYDTATGVTLSTTGMNSGQTFTAKQYDALLRPTTITTPENGESTAAYTSNQISAHTEMTSSQSTDQETFLDSYGRVKRAAVASSSGWYLTDSCYDATGLLQYQSTAYVSSSENPSSYNCSSSTGTQYTYDALGRKTAVAVPDGSSAAYTYQSRAAKSVSNGVTRITQYDLLGRISQVCEVSGNSLAGNSTPATCAGDITATGYATTYSYSLSGHSMTVAQGAQTRVFTTDAAGRTTQTNEPEAGIATYSYAYNGTGLVVTRSRPKANQTSASVLATTTTQYDALGRIVSVTYSDGTPTRSFGYDAAGNGSTLPSQGSSKGQMTSYQTASSSLLAARNFVYDIMGRVSETVDCLPGYCGSLPAVYRWYGYDLASNLTSEKYSTATGGGSPATQTYSYNVAGQLTSVVGTQGNGSNGSASYSTNPNTMTPFGPALTEYGNGLYLANDYDSSGHMTSGWTCSGSTQVGCNGGTVVYSAFKSTVGDQIKHSGDWLQGQQRDYGYDEFGRLQSLTTTPNSGPAIGMTFAYDRWGNRWQQNITAGSGPQPQLSFNTNNQVTTAGYAYDAVGNVTNDGVHSYTYDAENNLTQIDNGSTAKYQYGALNERRLASWSGQTQAYDFDLSGRRATTWVNTGSGVSTVQFYAGNQKHAYWSSSDNNFHFEHTDWLGTVRVRTNSVGTVEGSYNSLPFGDGTTVSGSDNSLNHFTGLDADAGATAGLSHAMFREYSSVTGRWTSPDPYMGSYSPVNPQSFNRYLYASNRPLSANDPTGLDDGDGNDCGDDEEEGEGGGSNYAPTTGSEGTHGATTGGTAPIVVAGETVTVTADPPPSIDFDPSNYSSFIGNIGVLIFAHSNPCSGAGNAPDPSYYANQGHADRNNPIQSTNHTLFGFPEGGANDAQPSGGSPYYANYVYGAYMQQAGFPKSLTIILANEYSVFSGISRSLRGLGPKYDPSQLKDANPWAPKIPASNVTAITQGFNAAKNGALCHK